MEYQLFEIWMLFAVYSIIGWLAVGVGFALGGGGFQNRGVCRGPGLISCGTGALLVLCGMDAIKVSAAVSKIVIAFVLGAAAGLLLQLFSMAVINSLCGERLIRLRWYQPVLCGLGAVILVLHVNPLLTAYIRWAPPWLHMIFLLGFYLKLVSDLPDGLSCLSQFRKKRHISRQS